MNFKPMFKYEQIVCSTWNNRRFSDSGRSGRRLGFRRGEVARKRAAAPPKKLEVPESLRRGGEVSSHLEKLKASADYPRKPRC